MKPQKFEYHAPTTIAAAAQLLADPSKDNVILSGGQSLMPILNLRLANPTDVIDIGRIDGLATITPSDDFLTVGAMATHRQMLTSELVSEQAPLAQAAAGYIGYQAIRNRGTIGGSIAHADPAAEWPVVLLALDGDVALTSCSASCAGATSSSATSGGGASATDAPAIDAPVTEERVVKSDDFFEALFATAKRPDELITSVRLATRFAKNWGFAEFQRRTGDFAVVMVAVACVVKDNVVQEARVSLGGVADRPIRCPAAEAVLLGSPAQPMTSGSASQATALADTVLAAAEAARDSVSPPSDLHGSAEFRQRLIFAESQRAIAQALGTQVPARERQGASA